MPSIARLCIVLAGFSSVQTHRKYNNSEFAADLSHQVSKEDPNGNFVFSPVSLEMVVAAILGGTRGNTNKQIQRHIFNTADRHYTNHYIESLVNSLETCKTGQATLKYTTILAVDNGFPVREQFKKRAGKNFPSGKLLQMNFAAEGDIAAAQINSIIANTTEDKIQDLIPYGSLNSDTAMVLVNALYLKADFEKKFERTKNGQFYDTENQPHNVEFLQNVFEDLPYYQNTDVKMIRIPFFNKHIHLYVATGIISNNVEKAKIDTSDIIRLAFRSDVNFQDRAVDVMLPKFAMNFSAGEMPQHFRMLNVTDLFDESRAKFGRLLNNPRQKVAVSSIRHKAFIEVSESGVEAAAASSLELGFRFSDGVTPDVAFHADHQFFFFITLEHEIRDWKFESIVFAGQYSTPPQ